MNQSNDDKARIWGMFEMDECPQCREAHALYLSHVIGLHHPGALYQFVCPESGKSVEFCPDADYYPMKSCPDGAIILRRIYPGGSNV